MIRESIWAQFRVKLIMMVASAGLVGLGQVALHAVPCPDRDVAAWEATLEMLADAPPCAGRGAYTRDHGGWDCAGNPGNCDGDFKI